MRRPIFSRSRSAATSKSTAQSPVFVPFRLPPGQVVGALLSLGFLAAFTWFFLKSRMGVATRAVADNALALVEERIAPEFNQSVPGLAGFPGYFPATAR